MFVILCLPQSLSLRRAFDRVREKMLMGRLHLDPGDEPRKTAACCTVLSMLVGHVDIISQFPVGGNPLSRSFPRLRNFCLDMQWQRVDNSG